LLLSITRLNFPFCTVVSYCSAQSLRFLIFSPNLPNLIPASINIGFILNVSMLKKYGYFLLLIFFLFAESCKDTKKISSCIGYVEMPKMFKDYFLFQDSSYWIYKDSISGDIDSIYSKEMRKEDLWPYKVVGTKDCPCYESYYYNFYSSFQGTQRVKLQSYFSKNPIDLTKENFVYNITLANSNKIEDRFVTIGYDSISPETPVIGGYIKKLDSFEVGGISFGETLQLYYPSINPSDWVREIYYTRNIGITKFRDNYNHVWELIKYKIKQ
jgi:hypothetical protein